MTAQDGPLPDGDVGADASLAQAKKSAPHLKKLLQGTHHGGMDSVREVVHNGHRIVVRTSYKITIDGKPFKASLGVTNSGDVHYHGMPNVAFASALDLLKAVVDQFPDAFQGGAHGGGHHHGHAAPRSRVARRKPGKRAPSRTRR